MYVQEKFQLPLTRASLAEHFHMSPTHVSRLFKRHGEAGFSEYLMYVRMDRAKYLLKSYGQTVGEVSAACGFNDPAYFCRVFKQVTKLTPSGYRMSAARAG
jgi:AraC-like DNA-binding protein